MKIDRVWAMPSKNTFDILPIGQMVNRYLASSETSVDPFARNKRWATYTNDLNPNTKAEYHLEALDFLKMLKERKVEIDLAIFDPPFSPTQVKECYEGIGLTIKGKDVRRSAWKAEKDVVNQLLKPDGVFLWFNWNSAGMGKKRNYEILEILLVCHGAGHNDTICMAERKMPMLF